MKKDEIPPLPTRQQELDYLKYLEKSISTDPWFVLRTKKYMASPWRLYWKKNIEMRKEYRKTFFKNFLISVVLSYPLVIYLSNRRQFTSTGVPKTNVLPSNIFNPTSVKIPYKNKTTRNAFNYGLLKYSVIFGIAGAFLFTDGDYLVDTLNARPDLGQFRAMTNDAPISEKKVFEFFDGVSYPDQDKPTILKRMKKAIWPSVDYNPKDTDYAQFFDYKRGYYPDANTSSYYSS